MFLGVLWCFDGFFNSTIFTVFLRCFYGVLRCFFRCFKGVLAVFLRCLNVVFTLFLRCFDGVLTLFLRCFHVDLVRMCCLYCQLSPVYFEEKRLSSPQISAAKSALFVAR